MKLTNYIFGPVALCAVALMPVSPVHAQTGNTQDSALLDALVKKGVLSDQEAEDITAQEEKAYSSTSASKIQLPTSVKSITFYGDVRMRYEYREGSTPGGTWANGAGFSGGVTSPTTKGADSQDLNRWRYRLRVGIKGTLYDDFFFGLRASTNPYYDRSGNVTFGASDGGGEFGKDRSLLALDQVYLGWKPTSDITLTGGQMANPFYTTSMVWDDNLNPAGAAEQWDHHFGDSMEVFATAGQFIYQTAAGNGITNNIGAGTSFSNTFMFGEQVGFKYNFDKNTFFKGAATFYTYSGTKSSSPSNVANLYSSTAINLSNASLNTGSGAPPGGAVAPVGGATTPFYANASPIGNENQSPSYFNGPFVGAADAPLSNVSGINDLAILEVPMEFDFTIGPGKHTVTSGDPKDAKEITTSEVGWSLPVRIFSDFAYNVEGQQRADAARGAINSLQSSVNASIASSGATAPTGNLGVTALPGSSSASQAAANLSSATSTNAMLHSNTFQGILNSGKGVLDDAAYQVGIEVGQLKKKGDTDYKLYWQSTGYYAVDPNLIDADIFNAATNMQGAVVSVAHNWTDGLTSTVRYAYGMPVNGKLATPNVNQDLTLGDIRNYNLFQADLMWKF